MCVRFEVSLSGNRHTAAADAVCITHISSMSIIVPLNTSTRIREQNVLHHDLCTKIVWYSCVVGLCLLAVARAALAARVSTPGLTGNTVSPLAPIAQHNVSRAVSRVSYLPK